VIISGYNYSNRNKKAIEGHTQLQCYTSYRSSVAIAVVYTDDNGGSAVEILCRR